MLEAKLREWVLLFFIVLSHQPLKSFVFVCTLMSMKNSKEGSFFQVHKFSKKFDYSCTLFFFLSLPNHQRIHATEESKNNKRINNPLSNQISTLSYISPIFIFLSHVSIKILLHFPPEPYRVNDIYIYIYEHTH